MFSKYLPTDPYPLTYHRCSLELSYALPSMHIVSHRNVPSECDVNQDFFEIPPRVGETSATLLHINRRSLVVVRQ